MIVGMGGTGGREKFVSSLASTLPTEKIVPIDMRRDTKFPSIVFGKDCTGNASSRSSSLRRASTVGGGILYASLGDRIAWTVKTCPVSTRCCDSRFVSF